MTDEVCDEPCDDVCDVWHGPEPYLSHKVAIKPEPDIQMVLARELVPTSQELLGNHQLSLEWGFTYCKKESQT